MVHDNQFAEVKFSPTNFSKKHVWYCNLQQYSACFIIVSSHRIKIQDGLFAEVHHLRERVSKLNLKKNVNK